jgi:hypothetical protein
MKAFLLASLLAAPLCLAHPSTSRSKATFAMRFEKSPTKAS